MTVGLNLVSVSVSICYLSVILESACGSVVIQVIMKRECTLYDFVYLSLFHCATSEGRFLITSSFIIVLVIFCPILLLIFVLLLLLLLRSLMLILYSVCFTYFSICFFISYSTNSLFNKFPMSYSRFLYPFLFSFF